MNLFKWLCRRKCNHSYDICHITKTSWTLRCTKCGNRKKVKL